MTDLPEFVYLVTTATEWPVSVLVNDNDGIFAERVERVVARRRESANVYHPGQVHVWKARLAEAVEVDLLPSATTRPSIRERGETP